MIRSNLTNIEGRWLDQSNHQGAGLRLQTACEEEQGGAGQCIVYGDGGIFFDIWSVFLLKVEREEWSGEMNPLRVEEQTLDGQWESHYSVLLNIVIDLILMLLLLIWP